MYCKSCGEPLGDPEEDLHDPDNKAGIIEGGVENPDSAHLVVVDGPGDKDNHRLQCTNKGQMTSIVEQPPPEGSDPSGGEPTEKKQGQPTGHPRVEEVYDMGGPQGTDDIVMNVISNPIYGLSEEQIAEIRDWVNIYDGQIPPDDLEAILSDFDKVADQSARLMRKKYEAKLNQEMRKRAENDKGPSIGALGRGTRLPQQGGGPPGGRQPQQPSPAPQPRPGGAEGGGEEAGGLDDLRTERRRRRVERRNDAIDQAAEEFANQAASEIASGAGGLFGDISDALGSAFKMKAKKDPDWFFEKMEKWDIDVLDALLEPSDARKEELDRGVEPGSQLDNEIEEALNNTGSVDESDEEHPTETAVGETEMEDMLEDEMGEVSPPNGGNERLELDDLMEAE